MENRYSTISNLIKYFECYIVNFRNLKIWKFFKFFQLKFFLFFQKKCCGISQIGPLEFSKLTIFKIFKNENVWEFPDWIFFFEFPKLKVFRIFQFWSFWNCPNWKIRKCWDFFNLKNQSLAPKIGNLLYYKFS